MNLVYFSSTSENTHRFVQKLHIDSERVDRIPLRRNDDPLLATDPYVLIIPTYGAGRGEGAVPKQVITFLNDVRNRTLIRAVIVSGNTNFGSGFGLAGRIVSAKCSVPLLHAFEVLGTQEDVDIVNSIIEKDDFRDPR